MQDLATRDAMTTIIKLNQIQSSAINDPFKDIIMSSTLTIMY